MGDRQVKRMGWVVVLLGLVAISNPSQAEDATSTAPCDPTKNGTAISLRPQEITQALCKSALIQPTKEEIRKILLKELGPHTFALQRKVYFYHYGKNPAGGRGPIRPDDHELAERFVYDKKSGRDFFDPNKYYGLYTATDPLVSLDYSDDESPLLIQLGISAGIRYLVDEHWKLSQEDAVKIGCYLESKKENSKNESFSSGYGDSFYEGAFIANSQEARELLKGVFKELKIQLLLQRFRGSIFDGCPGENEEIKIIDPELSPQIEKTLFTFDLEKNPSPEKKAAYRKLFEYFNTVTPEEIKKHGQGDVSKKFWAYYNKWAPILDDLPPRTNLKEHQAQQNKRAAANRKAFMAEVFGCSDDPRYKDEILKE